jgi:hypothetical protein
VPFNNKDLNRFLGTYHFSHDCKLSHNGNDFNIVNGHANNQQAVVSLSMVHHDLALDDEVTVTWMIGDLQISLQAIIVSHDKLYKKTSIRWCDDQLLVTHLFNELTELNAFSPAFTEDVQANKLDTALRNLLLSNLPKVTILANIHKKTIALNTLIGHSYLPTFFIDESQRVKLDLMFSQAILLQLAQRKKPTQEMLFVMVHNEKVVARHLLCEFSSPVKMMETLKKNKQARLYAFTLDVNRPNKIADDAIITIEHKYLSHYSPTKAKKLDEGLAYNMSIGLIDVSALFSMLIEIYG